MLLSPSALRSLSYIEDDFISQYEGGIIHRVVEYNSDSKDSLELIQQWIKDCDDSHKHYYQVCLPYLRRYLDRLALISLSAVA